MVDTIARFEELYAHRVSEMGQEPDTDYSDNAGLEEIVVYEYFSQQEALREVGPLVERQMASSDGAHESREKEYVTPTRLRTSKDPNAKHAGDTSPKAPRIARADDRIAS